MALDMMPPPLEGTSFEEIHDNLKPMVISSPVLDADLIRVPEFSSQRNFTHKPLLLGQPARPFAFGVEVIFDGDISDFFGRVIPVLVHCTKYTQFTTRLRLSSRDRQGVAPLTPQHFPHTTAMNIPACLFAR
jgi:hypothetical protein